LLEERQHAQDNAEMVLRSEQLTSKRVKPADPEDEAEAAYARYPLSQVKSAYFMFGGGQDSEGHHPPP
jgi:hypothetical protein